MQRRVRVSKYRDLQRTPTVTEKIQQSQAYLACVATVLILVSGAGYIVQINKLATKGYEISDYEARLQVLRDEYKNMKAEEAQLRSIKNLDAERTRLAEVDARELKFVKISSSAVAMR